MPPDYSAHAFCVILHPIFECLLPRAVVLILVDIKWVSILHDPVSQWYPVRDVRVVRVLVLLPMVN